MATAPEFGPPQTVKISDLEAGDFVIEIPAQMRIAGQQPRSAIKTIAWAWETEGAMEWTERWGRRKITIPSKIMTFISGGGSADYPADFAVIIRRAADTREMPFDPAADMADEALSADEIAPCQLCADPSCLPGQAFCARCQAETAPAEEI